MVGAQVAVQKSSPERKLALDKRESGKTLPYNIVVKWNANFRIKIHPARIYIKRLENKQICFGIFLNSSYDIKCSCGSFFFYVLT